MADTPAYLDLAKQCLPLGWQLQRRHFQWQTSPLGHGAGSAGDSPPSLQPLRQAAQFVGLPPELGDGSGFSNFVDSSDSLPDINTVVRNLPPTAQIPEINRTPSESTRYPGSLVGNNPDTPIRHTGVSQMLGDFEAAPPQEDQGDRETFNRQSLFEENSGSTDSSSPGTQDIARKEANRYPGPLVGNNPDIPIRHIGGSQMLGDFETEPPQDQGGREAFNQPSLFEETFGFTDTEDTSTVDQPVDDPSIDSVKKLSLDGQPPSPLQRLPLGQRQPLGFNRPAITSDSTAPNVPVQRLPNTELSPLDTSEQSLSGPSVDAAEQDISQPDVSQPAVIQSTDDSPALRARAEINAEISPETSLENPIQRTPTTPLPEESVTAAAPTESSTDHTIPLDLRPDLPLEQDSISDIPTADATVMPVQRLPIETAPEAEPPIDLVAHPPSDIPTDPVTAIDIAPTEPPINPTPIDTTDTLSDTVQADPEPSLTSPLPLSPEQPDLAPTPEPGSLDAPAVAHATPFSELTADIPSHSLTEAPTPDPGSPSEPVSTDGTVIQPKSISPETVQPVPEQLDSEIPEQSSDPAADTPTANSLPENIAQLRSELSALEGTAPEVLPQDMPALEERHSLDHQPHVPESLPASPGETSPSLESAETSDDSKSAQLIPQADRPLAVPPAPDQLTPALPVPTETPNLVEPAEQPIQIKLLSDAVTQPLGRHKSMFDDLQDTIKEQPPAEPARSQVTPPLPTIQAKQSTDQPSRSLSSKLVSLTSTYGLPDGPSEPWLESVPTATLETSLEETPIVETAETVSLSVTQALAEMADTNKVAHVSSGEDEDQALWQLAYLLYGELRHDWVVRSQISDNFQRASPALMPIRSGDNKYPHLPLTLWPPPAHQLVAAIQQQLTIKLRQDNHRRAQPSALRRYIS